MGDHANREELLNRIRKAEQAGGEERIDKQHESGKLTARERIDRLLDKDSLVEIDKFVTHHCTHFGMEKKKFPGDGVVTGYGTVDGRTTFVYAQDFSVLGGTLGRGVANKICKVMEMAMKNGAPIVGLNDSGGARIQEAADPAAKKAECVAEYQKDFANPCQAAELGYVDEVILPEQTRPKNIRALEMLANKREVNPRKKHDNIPL
jgi:acetyl-CoA carboxylase carboxyltransferase component